MCPDGMVSMDARSNGSGSDSLVGRVHTSYSDNTSTRG